MSNRIELERSFILNEAEEKRIMEKIKQLGYIEYVSFKKHRTTYTKTINGILSKEKVLDYFKDFEIKYYAEKKYIKDSVMGEKKKWHVFEIMAMKNGKKNAMTEFAKWYKKVF